ncbi:protein unc-79 homolog isoform X2 [Uranotaenia lowii]|uniref:protein unc-79 homolog isoform X2 n=1 Tax=Uranotaenia lowii TaxID=190385 RepID=UPI002479E936|nr:protein unc-79 homolog isoform X2 [Uranotaenia lowii]
MTGSFRVQLVNMGTRGAAFQAKLRCLHEYHVRLLSNQIPAPSGSDIANTIKYFSQTLLTVLKDVPCSPLEMIKDPSLDQVRMSSYPNLEYQNLYNALTMLLDVASSIQNGLNQFGKALLQCLGCILPFLDRDLIDNLPYLAASSISVLSPTLHQEIINYLCYFILPFTITRQSDDDQECHACQSVSAVIMLVFQYSNNPAHHCQLLECLMRLKHNVAKDLLCVIAYGTAASRASAAKLLFYYWPAFDPNLFDRKGLLCKFTNNLIPFVCQRESCPNAGNAEAVKVCYDHCISILYATDSPPPLYLCIECANEIHRDHPDLLFGDILHPMQQVSMICENKNCRSSDKSAVSICFSSECASYNGNHPIRYCAQCHGNRHNSRRGIDHIVHRSLPPMMMMDAEMQTYMVEAVISLLREAKPLNLDFGRDSASDSKSSPGNGPQDTLTLEDRQLLGRYGIWLLVGRCKPTADTPIEILGRLLSMLFHWFHITAYSYDGQAESTLEKLKLDHVCGWLKDVCDSHYKEFIDCLLPHPPEYSRVGGHWDTLASRTSHLKEGLQRLICLIPYEIITQQIWDTVMPHWMEAVTNDVPEKELQELKIVLSKILDPDMSPLGFDAKAMYNFVTIRFEKTTAKVQQQALHWLQNLTKLEILIPLPQLFAMFGDGVRIMKHGVQAESHSDKSGRSSGVKTTKEKDVQPPRRSSISPVVEDDSGNTSAISDDEAPISRHTEFSSDAEHNLTCCILMLDILLKQMELQEIEQHSGILSSVSESIFRLLKCMVTAAKVGLGNHICLSKECGYCEASVMWHQLSTKIVQYLAPLNPMRPPDPPLVDIIDDDKPSRKSPPESEKESKSRERDVSLSMAPLPIPLGPLVVPSILDDVGKIIIMAGPVPVAVPQPEPHSVGGALVHMPHVCSIMTATVETVSEQLDLAAIIPSEKIVTAVARSVTLSDADVATATVQIAKPTIVGDNYEGDEEEGNGDAHYDLEDGDDFWHTSVGKFKFSIDNLPQSLQYIHQLLKEIPTIEKPDILYYTLQCLKIMVLHGDAFSKAARDDRGFFIWCQENLLIKNLWELCNAEHSHICEVTVPTLLHCITLPLGSDVFWNVVHDAFHDSDWRTRFQAVERVTVIARFMDSTPLRSEVNLQASLATAFCHLIAACDDLNVHVAQRSTLYLGTIHDNAIQALVYCLESQFDMFIVDRPVVLQSIYQLHNMLSDRKVLTWEFFLNRFDTLFVEAQVNLEKNGDISHLRDLRNSENGSEILCTKINKAREALSQSDTSGSMSKTLSASFGTKWPYKRTMSAPATIIPRQESKIEKEKIYNRQVSAPILKRKSSRFGLGQFLSSGSNQNHLTTPQHTYLQAHSQHYNQLHPYKSQQSSAPTNSQQLQPHQNFSSHHPGRFDNLTTSSVPTTPNLISSQQYQQHQQSFFQQNFATSSATGAPDGHIHSIGGPGDDFNLSGCLYRVIDLEEADKETIHLLVFLLMQFMSRPDLAYPTDEKPMLKQQSIVLRHLYLLLGYNQTEKIFHIPPARLRTSAVFNSFIANLPQVLDQNHLMGWILLPTVIQVLLYAPNQGNGLLQTGTESMPTIAYNYSLWFMECHVRRNWMMALLVILYKYQYNQPPYVDQIQNLVRLVINSLDSHFHQCRRIPATVVMDVPSTRSRDLSQPSLGTEQDDKLQETPPLSPLFPSEGPSHGHAHSSKLKAKSNPLGFRKYPDSSLEVSDTESELVAIPESDISDNTLQGSSAPGSFDDTGNCDDICSPMKPDGTKNKMTTANFATAQLAVSTITAGDHDDKTELSKKLHKFISSASGGDKDSNTAMSTSSHKTSQQPKCSVQEGVRMMVTSSMLGQPKAQAILNPPANVQKAIVVTQITSNAQACKSTVSVCAPQIQAKGNDLDVRDKKNTSQEKAKPLSNTQETSANWTEQRSVSPTQKTLGRQKRVIEPSLTPASTPISNSGTSQNNSEENCSRTAHRNELRQFERCTNNYASPETPLSKMDLMIPPATESTEGLLSPRSIAQLEIPTPERLLPIGQHGKEGISALADRVREALSIPDISHLKHDSFDKSDSLGSNKDDTTLNSRCASPRKLIKQVALESPPHSDDVHNTALRSVSTDLKTDSANRDHVTRQPRQRLRKTGPFAIGSISTSDGRLRYAGSWPPSSKDESDCEEPPVAGSSNSSDKPSACRIGDECVCERCSECGALKEEYTDEEMGIMLIILGTFIHREPALAAPFLPDILTIVSRVALHSTFPWQCESTTHLPGGSQSVAHQFIRCVLHQLAPNGVFYQIFLTQANETVRKKFYKSVAISLNDFTELNPTSPVQLLVETLNTKKTLPVDMLTVILRNLSEYLQCLAIDSISGSIWSTAIQGLDSLFRRIVFIIPSLDEADNLLHIMNSILKVPQLSKNILEPFSKILSYAIQNLTLTHKVLVDLCHLNNRAFSKERDKLQLCRQMVFELVQALKFKTNIPDGNLLLLVGILLQDAGGAMPSGIIDDLPDTAPTFSCNIAEYMRQTYLNDIMEFLADFHTLSKIKFLFASRQNFKNGGITSGLSEDTLGGVLKGAVAQYLALEMSRGNSRDNRAVSRYLPWLNNAPSSLQQGPKEFTDCVGHMRLLSWLLMGSLTHTALMGKRGGHIGQHGAAVHYHMQHPVNSMTQPVPQESSCHIADHIQVIFAGFAEQSKTSVLHMSSLFHAFTLCQLWTVYLEQIACATTPSSEAHNITMGILFEFWAKVTPCILQLVSHSKLSESVNLHFLSLLEALKETRSTILAKLLPLWTPVLSSNTQLSGTLHVRLQNCRDAVPNATDQDLHASEALLKWLQRLQFKMGQIELQSSTATQFYSI